MVCIEQAKEIAHLRREKERVERQLAAARQSAVLTNSVIVLTDSVLVLTSSEDRGDAVSWRAAASWRSTRSFSRRKCAISFACSMHTISQ